MLLATEFAVCDVMCEVFVTDIEFLMSKRDSCPCVSTHCFSEYRDVEFGDIM